MAKVLVLYYSSYGHIEKMADAIAEVGIGEAVTSFLEAGGAPGLAERTLIRPPASRVGPLDEAERGAILAASPFRGRYDARLDRDSARGALSSKCGHFFYFSSGGMGRG